MINKRKRDKIIAQIPNEMHHAREHKKGRLPFWRKNERLYFGKKEEVEDVRANIGIANAKAQGFVDTLLSKIDKAPTVRFEKGEMADLKKAKRANALLEKDSAAANGNWAFKDLMMKKQAIICGRAIAAYYASSGSEGYSSHLEPVDPYDFLIDPSAGGMDIEMADYLGRTNIVKHVKDLKGN